MNDLSPDFSPGDAMIAPDFSRQWEPATESIAVVDVRPPWRTPCGHPSDVQICSRQICLVEGQIVRTDNLHGDSRPQGCAQRWAQ